ncbi:glycosyltransferase family A protein [uncultured Muribaculum sp.]|uniref:glycosyltransferase family A protein n=1 Tax=uncultured Muribaculum sp. TaxID=1918613 RepID=UPI0025D3CDF0|nr:glycosyltransferase family A protein [uncultured Muribaculum sp.]
MMESVLTVVIPVHDRERIVGATLESLERQGLMCPMILVDNNSSDGSFNVLKEWADARNAKGGCVTVLQETMPGAAAARNRGLREVDSPWVMFFDSDDLMLEGHLNRIIKAINDFPDADIIGWDVAVRQLDGTESRRVFADRDLMFRNMFNAIFATQRYAVRTDFFRHAGSWDASVMGWNDYETGMRLAAMNPRTVKLQGDPTVLVVEQTKSITGTDYSSGAAKWEHAIDCCEATLRRHGLMRELRWLELRRIVLAALYAREKSPEASRLYDEVMRRTLSARQRMLLHAAYAYTRHGGRGIHYLLRPFI